MEHMVCNDRLPTDLQIPPDLQQQFTFDPVQKRLTFHGFMYKSQFDRLVRLHQDYEYRRAIAELFRLSTVAEATPTAFPWFGMLAGIVVLLVALLGGWWLYS